MPIATARDLSPGKGGEGRRESSVGEFRKGRGRGGLVVMRWGRTTSKKRGALPLPAPLPAPPTFFLAPALANRSEGAALPPRVLGSAGDGSHELIGFQRCHLQLCNGKKTPL